mmetsp:Transcript_60389/g.194458  ORF Transcript_60389/g.194458 Transcript_60389/m.194458 type:complete len:212 (-) Transcript_60389:4-639(-)
MARSPLTRATPMTSWTVPPVLSMRARSPGWSGLWSVVSPPSVPGPSTMLPSARPRRMRLSPRFATRRLYFSLPGTGRTRTKVPVEPLGCCSSRNSRSKRKAKAVMASSSSGAPRANSSSMRCAMKDEHWSPPWPSSTPKRPHVSCMKITCMSSMEMRQPFISATPTRNRDPLLRSTTTDVTAFGKPWPIAACECQPTPKYYRHAPRWRAPE